MTTLALIVGANLFTEPYLLTGGGGPNGATMSPALLIYQDGVEQGKPGVGAAIGILLTLFVLLVAGLVPRGARWPRHGGKGGHEERLIDTQGPEARRHVRLRHPRGAGQHLPVVLHGGRLAAAAGRQCFQRPDTQGGNIGLQNYRDVNRAISLLPSLANSAVFTLGTVVLTIVIGLPAGYALARLRFPGKPRWPGC